MLLPKRASPSLQRTLTPILLSHSIQFMHLASLLFFISLLARQRSRFATETHLTFKFIRFDSFRYTARNIELSARWPLTNEKIKAVMHHIHLYVTRALKIFHFLFSLLPLATKPIFHGLATSASKISMLDQRGQKNQIIYQNR